MIKVVGKIAVFCLLIGLVLIDQQGVAQISLGSDLSKINYEKPVEYIIGGVEVSGVEFLDKNVIIMLSEIEIGKRVKIPGDEITSAIRKLWDQGLFDNISITATSIKGNNIFLSINLKERPRLAKFSFEGIRKTEADDIREKINLTRGDVVTDHLIIRTKNIIQKFYSEKGFLNSEVSVVEKSEKKNDNFVDLVITIKKNKKVKIKEINIFGNEALNDDAVKSSMKETKARGVFRPLDSLGPLLV
ncbi:MAG: outer membrane protein assembly factor BamA, partial [Bacteroidetes bacterium CG_4_10_14_3_um_filter_42_6]